MVTPRKRDRPNWYFCLFPACQFAQNERQNLVRAHINKAHQGRDVGIGSKPKISDKRPRLEYNAQAILATGSLTVTEDE